MIRYKQPATSAEFEEYFEFRWRMLRQPLGLSLGSERDRDEQNSFHLYAQDEKEKIIAIGRIHSTNPNEARIRYMAVDAAYRHRGIGSKILDQLEQYARQTAVKTCWLNARADAVGFYRKNQYVLVNECKSELSIIKHYRMEKSL